ncbi:ATP-binding cassette domain-containing protein, partial [Frankia sp. Cpl3]|nr:ATP-binding cassette domain-containing protein [Frankia sp. Cpl3]
AYSPNQPVLQNINVTIGRGEFVALIGGNGSGKTTLAKHCNGLYQPSCGAVYVDRKDTKQCSVAQLATQVAYCYQNPDHQIFQSTVWEEVS